MHITIRQAAEIMQRSERCIYGYIEEGKLTAWRVGRCTLLDEEEVRQFVPEPTGRQRLFEPRWRAPKAGNGQSITIVFLPIRQGQCQQLRTKLQEIYKQNQHTFPGTVARYITYREQHPEQVQIHLIWRKAIQPSDEERAAALRALQDDLAGELVWEEACWKEYSVMLHA